MVSEVNGTWDTAIEVPGTATLNAGGNAGTTSVSCASAGNCLVGGSYAPNRQHRQAFAVSEENGAWGTAREIPGTGTLNVGGAANVNSVSCASAGNCSVAGFYSVPCQGIQCADQQALVVSEVNGTWGNAEEIPNTATLNKGNFAGAGSVSCASPGRCLAGGFYSVSASNQQAFVVNET